MKPRIKYPSDDYLSWRYMENMRHSQRTYNLEISRLVEDAAFNAEPRYKVNTDVLMPYLVDPSTGIKKYIKAL